MKNDLNIDENLLFMKQFNNNVKNNSQVSTQQHSATTLNNRNNSVRSSKGDDTLEMDTSDYKIERTIPDRDRNLSVYEHYQNKIKAIESFKRSLREVYDFNLR